MPERLDTYAPVRPVAYLLGQVASQVLTCPVRHGATGALVSPDAAPAAQTITITDPSGVEVVSAAAVGIVGSVATYTLTGLDLRTDIGAGWTVAWSLTIGGVVYTWQMEAYLCAYVPSCPISVLDLFVREPELRQRVPQAQSERGDNTGWQPQIDDAYYDLIQALIDRGVEVWHIRGLTGLREWLRTRTLMNCCRALSTSSGDAWDRKAGVYYSAHKQADGSMVVQLGTDDPTVRTGRGPFRLAPVGRPLW